MEVKNIFTDLNRLINFFRERKNIENFVTLYNEELVKYPYIASLPTSDRKASWLFAYNTLFKATTKENSNPSESEYEKWKKEVVPKYNVDNTLPYADFLPRYKNFFRWTNNNPAIYNKAKEAFSFHPNNFIEAANNIHEELEFLDFWDVHRHFLYFLYALIVAKNIQISPNQQEQQQQLIEIRRIFNISRDLLPNFPIDKLKEIQQSMKNYEEGIQQTKKAQKEELEESKNSFFFTEPLVTSTTLKYSLKVGNITALFDSIQISEYIPFISYNGMYKVYDKSFSLIETWARKRQEKNRHFMYVYVYRKKGRVTKESYDYSKFTIDTENMILVVHAGTPNEKSYIDLVKRFRNAITHPQNNLFDISLISKKIGISLMVNVETKIIKDVFNFYVTNGRQDTFIKEKESKIASEKQDMIFSALSPTNQANKITYEFKQNINQIRISMRNFHKIEKQIPPNSVFTSLLIRGIELAEGVPFDQNVFLYIALFNSIIIRYRADEKQISDIFNSCNVKIAQPVIVPGRGIAYLKTQAPDVFVRGYARVCQRPFQPKVVFGYEEIKDKSKESYWNDPPGSDRYFLCDNPNYRYLNLIKSGQALSNYKQYPRVPCCQKERQVRKIGAAKKLISQKFAYGGAVGVLPEKIIQTLTYGIENIDLQKEGELYERKGFGVENGNQWSYSVVMCMEYACSRIGFSYSDARAKGKFIKEMYNKYHYAVGGPAPEEDIDPVKYRKILEEIYKVNVFVFLDENLVTNDVELEYEPQYEKSVFIYSHFGTEMDVERRSELIVKTVDGQSITRFDAEQAQPLISIIRQCREKYITYSLSQSDQINYFKVNYFSSEVISKIKNLMIYQVINSKNQVRGFIDKNKLIYFTYFPLPLAIGIEVLYRDEDIFNFLGMAYMRGTEEFIKQNFVQHSRIVDENDDGTKKVMGTSMFLDANLPLFTNFVSDINTGRDHNYNLHPLKGIISSYQKVTDTNMQASAIIHLTNKALKSSNFLKQTITNMYQNFRANALKRLHAQGAQRMPDEQEIIQHFLQTHVKDGSFDPIQQFPLINVIQKINARRGIFLTNTNDVVVMRDIRPHLTQKFEQEFAYLIKTYPAEKQMFLNNFYESEADFKQFPGSHVFLSTEKLNKWLSIKGLSQKRSGYFLFGLNYNMHTILRDMEPAFYKIKQDQILLNKASHLTFDRERLFIVFPVGFIQPHTNDLGDEDNKRVIQLINCWRITHSIGYLPNTPDQQLPTKDMFPLVEIGFKTFTISTENELEAYEKLNAYCIVNDNVVGVQSIGCTIHEL